MRALASSAALAPAFARWWLRRLWSVRSHVVRFAPGSDRIGSVPRRVQSDVDWERLLDGAQPAALSGVVAGWPLFGRCTPEHLRGVFAKEWASVLVAPASSRDFGRAWLARSRVRMPVATLLDEVFASEPGDVRYYAWALGLGPLERDFDRPESIGGRTYLPSASSLWIGQAGNLTSLHYDHWHGLLGQLTGRKRVVLFAPSETPNLYARSPFSPLAASSRLPADCLRAAPSEFPRFLRARGAAVTLEPGDLLYLPPFWWHQAECLDASVSITLRYDPTRREAANASSLPRRLRRARADLRALGAHVATRRRSEGMRRRG